MVKTDCRRDALGGQPGDMDSVEAVLHRLKQTVTENGELIQSIERQLTENRDLLLVNARLIDDLIEKMDRLMTHLGVPPKSQN